MGITFGIITLSRTPSFQFEVKDVKVMMRIVASHFICTIFLFAISYAELCKNDAGDDLTGGSCYLTSHTITHPIDSNETSWKPEGVIKEYHFHTYWFQDNPESYTAALRIQTELINAVAEGKFVVVLPGITEDIIPGINEDRIPPIYTKPLGPHPVGSFETWVPREYLNDAVSFFMQRRGELSILLHPLTRYDVEAHYAQGMWLGTPLRLDYSALPTDTGAPRAQYPELKLGYSAEK